MFNRIACALGLSLLVAASAHAAPKTLKAGSLICATEAAYDTQMKYLANNVNKYAPGCGSSNKDYQVIIIDLNLLSASEVTVIENGMTVWVAHESLR